MDQANVLGLKLPHCIAALNDSKLPLKKGERTEFHIKFTINLERSIRKTRHSRRPIPGFRATMRVDQECRTASADTKGASCVLIKESILYQVFFLGQLMCRGFLGSHTY